MRKSVIIGIVGGIGSGKSTVARAFGDAGCAVIDADVIAQKLLDRDDICAPLADKFGPGVLAKDGRIDRSALAKIVFSSADDLKFLTDLLHPPVLERAAELIDRYQNDPQPYPAIVLDMPLLIEVGWDTRCDFIVFVDCHEAIRRARVKNSGKFDAEQIKNRENFQISLDKKREKAHYSIHNNSDESDIAGQVALILANIKGSI